MPNHLICRIQGCSEVAMYSSACFECWTVLGLCWECYANSRPVRCQMHKHPAIIA